MLRHRFRSQRRGSARWVAAAAATLALTAAVGLTVASPAHAETLPIADSFENGGWKTQGVPGMTEAFVGTFPGPHSGTELAYLDAYPNAPAEARIFRGITLDNGAPLPRTCRASIWFHSYIIPAPGGGPLPPIQTNVQVFLRVRSGGASGQIISVFGYNLRQSGWGTTPLAFNPIPWPADSRTITIEIAAYRGLAAADDFTFSC